MTDFGLAIRDRDLMEHFGKQHTGEFLRDRETFYNDYIQKQFSHPNFPSEYINGLLGEAGLPKMEVQLPRFATRGEASKLRERNEEVKTQLESIRSELEEKRRRCAVVLGHVEELLERVERAM